MTARPQPLTDETRNYEEFRAGRRTAMFVAATCVTPNGVHPVRIRNMSREGVLLEGEVLPRPGETFELVRAHLRAAARAMWVEDGQCGAAFNGAIDVAAWMARQTPGQLRVDAMVQQARSDIAAGRPAGAGKRPSGERSDNLRLAIALLEEVDSALSGDALIVARHQDSLQALDRAVQLLRAAKAGLPV